MPEDLLKKITDSIGVLSLSETKVASCIVADPEIVVKYGMAKIATIAEVSEPTVMRFCRSLGFDGFGEFKKVFTVYLKNGGQESFTTISDEDSVNDIFLKTHHLIQQDLKELVSVVDMVELQQVCEALVDASMVAILVEQSLLPTAYAASNMFLSVGCHSVIYSGSSSLEIIVKALPPKAVLLLLSEDGTNEQFLTAINQAKRKRFSSVSLTKCYSALAAACNYSLCFPEGHQERSQLVTANSCGLMLVDVIRNYLQKQHD